MPSKLKKNILVIDIEATCWKTQQEADKYISEIIEIGIAVIDIKSLTITKNENIIVRNVVSSVSEFCTELTGHTEESLKDGVTLSEACTSLRKEFDSKNHYWASYGNYDCKMFQKQCAANCIQYPFHDTHFNVKSLMALALALENEVSMPEALDKLNLPLIGRHHSGKDDAYNIANILLSLMTVMQLTADYEVSMDITRGQLVRRLLNIIATVTEQDIEHVHLEDYHVQIKELLHLMIEAGFDSRVHNAAMAAQSFIAANNFTE